MTLACTMRHWHFNWYCSHKVLTLLITSRITKFQSPNDIFVLHIQLLYIAWYTWPRMSAVEVPSHNLHEGERSSFVNLSHEHYMLVNGQCYGDSKKTKYCWDSCSMSVYGVVGSTITCHVIVTWSLLSQHLLTLMFSLYQSFRPVTSISTRVRCTTYVVEHQHLTVGMTFSVTCLFVLNCETFVIFSWAHLSRCIHVHVCWT